MSRSGNVDPPMPEFEFNRLKAERARLNESIIALTEKQTALSVAPIVSQTVRGGAFSELRNIGALEDRRRRERIASSARRARGLFKRDLPSTRQVSRQFFTPGLEDTAGLFSGDFSSGTTRKLGRPRKETQERKRELAGAGISTEINISPTAQARKETPRRRVALKGVQRETDKASGEVTFLVGTEFGVIRVPGNSILN